MEPISDRSKKVLVIESGKFLGEVVLGLIEHQSRFDVVSIVSDDCSEIIREISRLVPDSVIVDDRAYKIFGSGLTACLDELPNLKIVVLSSKENKVEVYSKNRIVIRRAADFFAVF